MQKGCQDKWEGKKKSPFIDIQICESDTKRTFSVTTKEYKEVSLTQRKVALTPWNIKDTQNLSSWLWSTFSPLKKNSAS